MLRLVPVLFLSFIWITFAQAAQAKQGKELPVQTIYGLIGKTYTDFDPLKSDLSPGEAAYLDALFEITDEGVRARVMMMQAFRTVEYHTYYKEKYVPAIEKIMVALSALDAPNDELAEVERLVSAALMEQYQFIANLVKKYKTQKAAAHIDWHAEFKTEHVQKAHTSLLRAYSILKGMYYYEDTHNLKSFYEHLCALDFI